MRKLLLLLACMLAPSAASGQVSWTIISGNYIDNTLMHIMWEVTVVDTSCPNPFSGCGSFGQLNGENSFTYKHRYCVDGVVGGAYGYLNCGEYPDGYMIAVCPPDPPQTEYALITSGTAQGAGSITVTKYINCYEDQVEW